MPGQDFNAAPGNIAPEVSADYGARLIDVARQPRTSPEAIDAAPQPAASSHRSPRRTRVRLRPQSATIATMAEELGITPEEAITRWLHVI
jgi:hypothetical protein